LTPEEERAPLGLRGVSSVSRLVVDAAAWRRMLPRSARRRRLNSPSSLVVVRVDELTESVLSARAALRSDSGVRSFHAAMMLRTDVSGERASAGVGGCGRRSGAMLVAVAVYELAV
jgi:hypothetical protein